MYIFVLIQTTMSLLFNSSLGNWFIHAIKKLLMRFLV